MEPPPSYSYSPFPFSLERHPQIQMHDPILFFLFFASLSSLLFLSFSLFKRFSTKREHKNHTQKVPSLLEEEHRPKKKRKKPKKKRTQADDAANSGSGLRLESTCQYPFTSSSSVMQRKIKQQYDDLVKCNHLKKLTLPQVVQFANSLIDARNELQHKADVIQRKFVITKALLCKADRSSFDRLHQQIYKLELEQKRLEEDAFVYNSLQQQLKLSPAYQKEIFLVLTNIFYDTYANYLNLSTKMLELGACMEKEKSSELGENRDEFAEITFEELLAQEKKDSFWQRNGKSRLSSS
ncbi:hypothetical protein JHK82_038168 [Glycine max]|nr:hypothetical protein JHK85_038919 [Glycine max]KAG5114899.1 hypothetical protein JHK82_038168 [Glycine max]KAG5132180.1 hypothetical protein JHK84_038577 [Glycine max]